MALHEIGFTIERKDTGYKRKFYGKYRAIVTNNKDTNKGNGLMGRIKVKCPKVYGDDESPWCLPCIPLAGNGRGLLFMPKVGDTVWIEFEEGDPKYPIWVGNWYGAEELPKELKGEFGYHHIIATDHTTIHINDKDRITVIQVSSTKITINGSTGKVTIDGNLTVNGGITSGDIHSTGDITATGSITPNV